MYRYIPAESRWISEAGWLSSRFSFSFAEYYNPERMGFWALRVINDDTIAPKSGFGKHGHRDMEIITIVLEWTVEHEDSLGNKAQIQAGEIQVMHAGSGIIHSEMNPGDIPLKLLQIWIIPNVPGISSGYETSKLPKETGTFHQIWWITASARLFIGTFEKWQQADPPRYDPMVSNSNWRWTYLFVIDGEFQANGKKVNARDALELEWEPLSPISALEKWSLLIFDLW